MSRSVPAIDAQRLLPGTSSLAPAGAAALPRAASARWDGAAGRGAGEGRDASKAISVSVPDKQMEAALSYYLRAKREKPRGALGLADQWALWAPAAAGCFPGVAATPTSALDSVCIRAAPSPWEQVRYMLLDVGSALAARGSVLCCWGQELWLGGQGAWGCWAVQGLCRAGSRPSQVRLSEEMVMGARWWR